MNSDQGKSVQLSEEASVEPGEITLWLEGWKGGDAEDRERLMEWLYPRLKRLVGRHLNQHRAQVSLQTTELIHELYLRLDEQQRVLWQDRRHFFAVAGRLLRRVIVDHERHRRRHKRGGGITPRPLDEALTVASPEPLPPPDVLALDLALVELEGIDPRAARVTELRYFAGLSHDEAADLLGVGRATVARSWRFARAWLRGRLAAPPVPVREV